MIVRFLILTLLLLLVAELGPPIWRGAVPEGLAVVEAHDKPKPKPDPGPGRDPYGVEVREEARYWWVVRRIRPLEPVYGPFMSSEPECRGYERRFPTLYVCRRLP